MVSSLFPRPRAMVPGRAASLCCFGVNQHSHLATVVRKTKRMSEETEVSVLARAIAGRQWELAALCLVLGLLEAVAKLPADAIIGLFDVLDGGEDGSREG